MSRVDPPCAERYRTRIDLRYTQLLEAFNAAYDIHHSVNSPDFVQGNILRPHSMNPPFGLAEKPKGLYCSITYPVRYVGALHQLDQICYVAMITSVMGGRLVMVPVLSGMCVVRGICRAAMVMFLRVFEGPGRKFLDLTGEENIHLDRAYAAPEHGSGHYLDLGKPEPGGQLSQPFGRCSCGHDCSQQHVAADPGGRVQNRKTSIGHRLRI
jgi:hypothetical protein